MLSVLALFLFGGKVIQDFSFALLVGIIVGAYSSIYIASALVIDMTQFQERRNAKIRGGSSKPGRKQIVVRPDPKFQE